MQKPPPWAALRAGRISAPSRMHFGVTSFYRETFGLAENQVQPSS